MRKYVALLALVLATASASFAQLNTGTVFTGLHASGSIKRPDANTRTSNLSLTPTVGYFVSSRWMAGLQATYTTTHTTSSLTTFYIPGGSGYTSYTSTADIESQETTWGLGPVIRYYLPLSDRFSFFAEGTSGYAYYKSKRDINQQTGYYQPVVPGQPAGPHWGDPNLPGTYVSNSTVSSASTYGNIASGITFFPVPKVGVELKVNLVQYNKQFGSKGEVDAHFNLSRVGLGAGFYF